MKYFSQPWKPTYYIIFNLVLSGFMACFLSSIVFQNSLWNLNKNQVLFVSACALAYFAGAVSIFYIRNIFYNKFICRTIIITASFGILSFLFLIINFYYSKLFLLLSILTGIFFINFQNYLSRRLLIGFAASLMILAVIAQLGGDTLGSTLRRFLVNDQPDGIESRTIETEFYTIKATRFNKYFQQCERDKHTCQPPKNGGGLDQAGKGYVLSDGDGLLYYFVYNKDLEDLSIKPLPYKVPLNSREFIKTGDSKTEWLFRVTDILVKQAHGNIDFYAAHHFWKPKEKCFVMRISKLSDRVETFISGKSKSSWETVFETSPCLPLNQPLSGSHSSRLFSGDESGGRLSFYKDNKLLLTVGDHLFNGYDRKPLLAQDNSSSYGKILLVDPARHTARIFTKGHRNPQGLLVDSLGNIWATEHGPRGGDELNLLVHGKNYGWPIVTYGTDYGKKIWPPSPDQGEHPNFAKPIFSWVPSVAVSNLIESGGTLFPLWKGDLLVGSYKKILFRIHIRDKRVIYVEPILIGERNTRIRDLMEDQRGKVILWLDDGSIVFLEPITNNESDSDQESATKPLKQGQVLFEKFCGNCHNLGPNDHGIGPSLAEIVGRDIAGANDYQYSLALSKTPGSWTKGKLDLFIEHPEEFAPGNKMEFKGVQDPEQRSLIIEFLTDTRHNSP